MQINGFIKQIHKLQLLETLIRLKHMNLKTTLWACLALFILCFASFSLKAQNSDTTATDSSDGYNAFGLGFEFGVGNVRQNFAPTLGFYLNFRKEKRYSITASYTSYYFFEREANRDFSMFTNGFVSLSYLRYVSKDMHLGLSVSYLTNSSGNYFKGTTMKLGILKRDELFSFFKLRVTPEIWFTNDFKTVFPGFSIKF
jgi:hypothetical protein